MKTTRGTPPRVLLFLGGLRSTVDEPFVPLPSEVVTKSFYLGVHVSGMNRQYTIPGPCVVTVVLVTVVVVVVTQSQNKSKITRYVEFWTLIHQT